MRAVWLWLRTGASIPLFLVVLGAVASTVLTSDDWHVEMDWGLRLTASSVVFVAPLVAASAAYETARRHRPVFGDFAQASVRGKVVHLVPVVATVLAAATAFVVAWLVVVITSAASGGIPPTDPWVFPETLMPVVAAAFLGGLVGHWLTGIGAPIAAVVAVFSTALLVSPWGRGPFEAVTTYGTLTGLERPPAQAAAAVLGAVVTVVLCAFAVTGWRDRRAGFRAAVVAGLVAAWVAPSAWPWTDQVYRVSTEATGCVGSEPALCGPRSRLPLLARAQPSFALAYERLRGTAFAQPTSFRVTRLSHYSTLGDSAPLDFDPASLRQGAYPSGRVVAALLRPHECKALFDAEQALPLLEAQERLTPWLLHVVEGRRSAQPVPPDVVADFSAITECDVFTGDWK